MSDPSSAAPTVSGTTEPRFAALRDAFAAAFVDQPTMGAAVAVHVDGRLVVDLWGGLSDARSGAPWSRDTSTVVFSCTKGVMSIVIARLVEAGRLDYDEPVASLWPEFAAHGKGDVTVGDVLAHRGGLSAPRDDLGLDDVLDWPRMTSLLAAQRPLWQPATGHAYHALTHGWLAGEIVRRVTGRMPGDELQEVLAGPARQGLRLGVPPSEQAGIARLEVGASLHEHVRAQDGRAGAPSPDWPTLAMTLGHAFPAELAGPDEAFQRADVRAAGLPGAGGVATARGLSAAWASVVADTDDGPRLDPATLARAVRPRSEGAPVYEAPAPWPRWGAGFQLDSAARRYLTGDGFGHDGAGGQVAFAEPGLGLGFAFVTNRMEAGADLRATRIVDALRDALT